MVVTALATNPTAAVPPMVTSSHKRPEEDSVYNLEDDPKLPLKISEMTNPPSIA